MVGMADLDPEALGDDLMATVAVLRRAVRTKLRDRVPGPRLRGAQLELLQAVHREPGIGVAGAARALRLAANSVSTLVNQLTDDGLLNRVPDPADRRAVRLTLTEPAERRLAAWRAAKVRLVGAGVAQLSEQDQRQLADALPALHTLIARLDDLEAQPADEGQDA